jgi:hypothetical protein
MPSYSVNEILDFREKDLDDWVNIDAVRVGALGRSKNPEFVTVNPIGPCSGERAMPGGQELPASRTQRLIDQGCKLLDPLPMR